MKRSYALLGRLISFVAFPILDVLRPARSRHRVRALLVNSDSMIMLVKDWLGPQIWSLPGGGVGAKEEPHAAVAREVREELGIVLPPDAYQYVGEVPPMTTPLTAICYVALVPSGEKIPKVSTKELLDAQWFPIDSLPACDPVVQEVLRLRKKAQ